MAKALAVERLMPAQQCTTIGARASQSSANASTRSTSCASGATKPGSGMEMSCTPSRRCRAGSKPAGVSINSSGLSRVIRCEGARSAITWGSSRSGVTIRTICLLGIEGLRGAPVAGGLGQQLEALKIARFGGRRGHRLDRQRIAGRRRAEQLQAFLVAEAGDLGRFEERAGAVGGLDQRLDRGRNPRRQAEAV